MMRGRGGLESTPKSWTIGGFVACCVAGVVVFVVMAVLLLAPLLSELQREVLSDFAVVPAAALVLLSSLRTSRVADRRLRTPWRLVSAAGLLWLLGEASWFIEHYVVRYESTPSVADVFYLSALVPAAAALLRFPPPHRGTRGRVISLLSCLVAVGSVLFIGRVITVRLGAPGGDVATAADLFYAVYPVADLALLALTLVALIRSGNRARTYLWLVAGGLATYVVADTIYSINVSAQSSLYTTGFAVDLLWFAGYQLIALAAVHPSAGTDHPGRRRGPARWAGLTAGARADPGGGGGDHHARSSRCVHRRHRAGPAGGVRRTPGPARRRPQRAQRRAGPAAGCGP